MKCLMPFCLVLMLLTSACTSTRGLLEQIGLGTGTNNVSGVAGLTEAQIVGALKQALSLSTEQAVSRLGQTNGFFQDLTVRIPMPESLRTAEQTLRTLGQNQLADQFVATMNHAAEKAVPAALGVFQNAIQQMTFADARSILTGPPEAATEFFRRTSETNLAQRFYPIVAAATSQVGVTSAYKQLVSALGAAGPLISAGAGDLDGYITRKSLDGLFLKMASEEKRIREDPVARTTELLQKVFGAVSR